MTYYAKMVPVTGGYEVHFVRDVVRVGVWKARIFIGAGRTEAGAIADAKVNAETLIMALVNMEPSRPELPKLAPKRRKGKT